MRCVDKGSCLQLLRGGGLAIAVADLDILGLFGRRGLPKLLAEQVKIGLDVQVALTAPCRVPIQLNALWVHLQRSMGNLIHAVFTLAICPKERHLQL